MTDLLGPDGQPVGPAMSPEETEWAIGEHKLPPTPGTPDEWREFAIYMPQMPMTVYIWIVTSIAMKELEKRIETLERQNAKFYKVLDELSRNPSLSEELGLLLAMG